MARILVARDGETDDEVVLKILRADVIPFDATQMSVDGTSNPAPGTIEPNVDGAALRIATGDGWLVPLIMQRAGGKALPIADFLRGFELDENGRCALPDLGVETP